MADRILVWHSNQLTVTPQSYGPTYYLEKSYAPTAVRLHCNVAPKLGDLKVDIKDDGVSIFTGYAVLPYGDSHEPDAEDFLEALPPLAEGSLITCEIVETNGAGGVTIQLELETIDEDSEAE